MKEKLIKDAHRVFCEVFNSNISYEAFYYKHWKNPGFQEGLATFVSYEREDPQGTNSFLGCSLLDGEKEIKATYSCDTAVREKYRGKRVFSKMIEDAIEALHKDGTCKLIYATPNQNSYPGFKKLGFYEIGGLKRYVCILHPIALGMQKILRKVLKKDFKDKSFIPLKAQEKGFEYEVALQCPFTELDIKKINSPGKIRLKKTKEFYQWKIDSISEGDAAYIKINKQGELAAYLVVKKSGVGATELVDYDFFGVSNAEKITIFKWIKSYLAKNSNFISVLGTTEELDMLVKNSFFERGADLPFMLWFLTENIEKQQFLDFNNWQLRIIDFDTILNR